MTEESVSELKFIMDFEKFRKAVMDNGDQENAQYLNDCLKHLLDPTQATKNIKCDGESDLVKCIIGCDVSLDDFLENLRTQNNFTKCLKSLACGDYRYKCQTCQLVPSMDLCTECFENGDHKGHKYVLKMCTSGFVCDCGKPEAIPEEAFCKNHRYKEPEDKEKNKELYKAIEFLIPHLFYKMLQYLREIDYSEDYDHAESLHDWYYIVQQELSTELNCTSEHLKLINDLCTSDFMIRKLLSKYLLSEEFYKEKKLQEDQYLQIDQFKSQTSKCHYNVLAERISKLKSKLNVPEELKEINFVDVQIKNMFDEFLFSFIYLKSSQFLFPLLLTFIKEEDVKDRFKKLFLKEYCLLDNLSSVYNNEYRWNNFCPNPQIFKLVRKDFETNFKQINLLETLLAFAYDKHKRHKFLNSKDKPEKRLVISDETKNIYEIIKLSIDELEETLKNNEIANHLISDEKLFDIWIYLVSFTQGMNSTKKSLENQYDYYVSDSIEHEFKLDERESVTIKELILKSIEANSEGKETVQKGLDIIKKHLITWKKLDLSSEEKEDDTLTFHLPLHRYLSHFIYKAIKEHGLKLKDLLPSDQETLELILSNPLKIQVGLSEIQVPPSEWNSHNRANQAVQYTKKHFIDFDFFLIQCIASMLEHETFIKTVLNQYQIFDICQNLLRPKPIVADKKCLDEDQEKNMIVGALALLAQITYRDLNLDGNNKNSIKYELIQFLSQENLKFSGIKSKMKSGRYSNVKDEELENYLNEIADFIQPDYTTTIDLAESHYLLKAESWKDSFDPLFHTFYRTKSFTINTSLPEHYSKIMISKNLVPNGTNLFPPFRIQSVDSINNSILKEKFGIVNSRTLHAVLFTLLYQHLYYDSLNEAGFQLVLYLIELAINNIETANETYKKDDKNKGVYSELDFSDWYKSDNILDNLTEIIPFINLERKQESNIQSEEKKQSFELIEDKIVIEESMISLLVKLFYKEKENEKSQPIKFVNEISESRIGDERFFINNLLNKAAKLSKRCKEKLDAALKPFLMTMNKTADEEESQDTILSLTEDQKAKALDRKQKILRSMSKQQEKFLDNAKSDKTLKRQTSQISFDETIDEDPNAFDCSICKSVATPLVDRPVGLMCIIHISKLSHIADAPKDSTPENDFTHNKSRSFLEQKRMEALWEAFSTESCKQSINMNNKRTAFIDTCGHYMHFDCYKNFKQSDYSKQFWCSICKKESNMLLPVKSSLIAKLKLLKINDSNEEKETSAEYIETLLKTDLIIDPNYVKSTLFCDEEALQLICELVANHSSYMEPQSNVKLNVALQSMKDSDALLFFSSILRNQLEVYESEKRIKHKCLKFNKSCFMPLFDLISTRCRLAANETKPQVHVWNLLTKSSLQPIAKSSSRKEVPMLLRDPIATFLLIILNWPTEFHRTTFNRIVNTVFNLAYVQGILSHVLKCSDEELTKLALKKIVELNQFDDYCALIASKLQSVPNEQRIKMNNQTNLGTKSETVIQNRILPFLKLTSSLQCHLFNEVPEHDESFESLVKYLQIYYNQDNSKNHLKWFETDPLSIVKKWMDEFLDRTISYKEQIETILKVQDTNYKLAELIQLPDNYTDLQSKYKLEYSSVCLICGTDLNYDEFTVHSETCADLYFNIYSCRPILYLPVGKKAWDSIYLDKHGETDTELERDEPMHLSKERYELLKQLWLHQSLNENFNYYV